MNGHILKELRKSKKLNQNYLANLLSISQAAYSKYECNLAEPDSESINKLATLYNVSADFLLGRTDVPNKPIEQGSIEEVKIELKRLGVDKNLEAQADLLRKINNLTEEQKKLILMMIGNFKE